MITVGWLVALFCLLATFMLGFCVAGWAIKRERNR